VIYSKSIIDKQHDDKVRIMTKTIYFYGTREKPYGCFSNFSRHGFAIDDVYWKTSEHYLDRKSVV